MTQRTFYVPRTVGPLQVELPEFKTKGRKGALHIRPSSTLFLSDDEVKHLEEKEAVLFGKLRETTPKSTKKTKSTFVKFGDDVKVETSFEGRSDTSFSGRKKKKDSE
jgi:hypothetical protein